MSEIKKATTYEEQLQILKERGLLMGDQNRCADILKEIGYYRFSAYLLPFKTIDGTYIPGTNFLRIYHIYEFDRKLRTLLFSALEEVEVSMRAKLSYYHAHKYGPTGYRDSSNFRLVSSHTHFMEQVSREIKSNETVPFVKHHIDNYNSIFPLWVVSELFTFGMLSRFYANMLTQDKKALFGNQHKKVESWLRCCTDLRNACAHYGRLYYRVFPATPAGFNNMRPAAQRRLWGSVMALRELYPNNTKWNNEVVTALEALIAEYSGSVSLYHMAFPETWDTLILK